jgi:hypothetical protein
MKLKITSVDHAPSELHDQVPFAVKLLRQLPGPDRPDYWLGEIEGGLRWIDANIEREVRHVILAARWVGTQIEPHVEHLPIGIAYVTDAAQLQDAAVSFEKCKYVAIGLASEVEGGRKPKPLTQILAGTIGRAFGMGRKS